MPLKIQGSVVVDAPREDVYTLLLDPELMKQVINKIPGISVEKLEQVSEDQFDGVATIGVAMVKGTYTGKILILDRRPGEYVKMRGEGKGGGNWTSGEAELTLVQQDNQTVMNYLGQGNVSGQLASVGQRLVDTVGRQFIDQGAKVFAEEIAQRQREKVAAATAATVASPTLATTPAPAVTPPRVAPAQPARAFPTWAIAFVVLLIAVTILAVGFNLVTGH